MLTQIDPVQAFADAHRDRLPTPYYLLDETKLLGNLQKVAYVRERTGAKAVLALKCFSTWAVFDLMRPYLDGTTSSSLYEARLGAERFGKETHAYCVAFSDEEIEAVRPYASKVIFNSAGQLRRFKDRFAGVPIGLRINPGVSHSHFDLADPSREFSRLGVSDPAEVAAVGGALDGAMFHCNCENDELPSFARIVERIAERYGALLKQLKWVSLGGGIYFTKDGYPIDDFCDKLAAFARRFDVQVYLEPGETVVTRSGYLVTRVLDVVDRGMKVAIVDAAVETHMPDLLIYGTPARFEGAGGSHRYMVAGRTCLAGDIFGTYDFPEPLEVGSLVPLADAAGYTMVKKNWFNGLPMPSIVVKRRDGRVEVVKRFGYEDYAGSLS